MTREHVIPSFAYSLQRMDNSKLSGWSEPANKMVGGEMKVKDVCEACNSKVLSRLDTYGKGLLESAGVLVLDFPHRSLTLRYEYDQLARWLLKISFNSSRADGVHAPLFEEYIPYVLGRDTTPSRAKLAILGYLAAPETLKLNDGAQEVTNPFIVRVGYGSQNACYTLRVVSFGPLFLILLIFRNGMLPGHASAAIRHVLKEQPGAVEIKPSGSYVRLCSGTRSWLDLYGHQVARTHDSIRISKI
ncbi:MAG: hypothetical protein Q8M77_05255 [Hydrogenophaga sp.]|nr:hypothetical protein [Hydrogenophaga sp.]